MARRKHPYIDHGIRPGEVPSRVVRDRTGLNTAQINKIAREKQIGRQDPDSKRWYFTEADVQAIIDRPGLGTGFRVASTRNVSPNRPPKLPTLQPESPLDLFRDR